MWGIIIASFAISWFISFKSGKLFDIKLLIVYLPIAGFIASVWYGTNYTITQDHLVIRIGPWFRKKIPLKNITGIKRNRSYISAPACSSERLLIRYGQYDEILISPDNEVDFVANLKYFNHTIKVEL
jgi:hypothetical protein